MALTPLVDRALASEAYDPLTAVEVEVEEPMDFENGAEVFEEEDGSALIQELLGDEEGMVDVEVEEDIPHNANLAEYVADGELSALASDLLAGFEDDMTSRADWEQAYVKGLDLLGVKMEERSEPFPGASNVVHPLISESVVQFQAQAYKELLPSGGPVRTRILGAKTSDVESQAGRVKEYMNYQITEVMEDYDPGMDQLLFYLPLSGSAFKKVYYDPARGRPVSEFIPAQDLVIPYSAVDLYTTPRATHVLSMTGNSVRKKQLSGEWLDVPLAPAGQQAENPVDEKIAEIEGRSPSMLDETRTILEMHVELDLPGFEDMNELGEETGLRLPYIVTLDKETMKILAIQRNWLEDDPIRRKDQFFVHYKFMPGLGFYGFGLIHMIGSLGKAATSLLRQLIDAGTLANLQGGFKARGVRVRNSELPLAPGEFRDVDAPGGNIRDAVMPLPFKEPSGTLAQLLGALVTDGRRFVSLADQQLTNMNNEMPVGTTVALLERGMKVMSAIHKRLHYAQKTEFRLLARVIARNLPPEYPYEVSGAERTIKASDFSPQVDVLPVSDPNIFSMAQRVTLAQTLMQTAQSAPEMHNMHAIYRRMYQALEVEDINEVLPVPQDPVPLDPAVENTNLLAVQVPQVFPGQDHEAHILAHIMLLQLPIVSSSPPTIAAITSHVLRHASAKARELVDEEIKALQQQQVSAIQQQAEAGLMAPEQAQMMAQQVMSQPMFSPEEVEARVAQHLVDLIGELMPMLNPQQGQAGEDPLVQIRQQELNIKAQEVGAKAVNDAQRLDLDEERLRQKTTVDAARLNTQEQIADDRNAVNRERIAVQRQAMQQADRNREN